MKRILFVLLALMLIVAILGPAAQCESTEVGGQSSMTLDQVVWVQNFEPRNPLGQEMDMGVYGKASKVLQPAGWTRELTWVIAGSKLGLDGQIWIYNWYERNGVYLYPWDGGIAIGYGKDKIPTEFQQLKVEVVQVPEDQLVQVQCYKKGQLNFVVANKTSRTLVIDWYRNVDNDPRGVVLQRPWYPQAIAAKILPKWIGCTAAWPKDVADRLAVEQASMHTFVVRLASQGDLVDHSASPLGIKIVETKIQVGQVWQIIISEK